MKGRRGYWQIVCGLILLVIFGVMFRYCGAIIEKENPPAEIRMEIGRSTEDREKGGPQWAAL